MALKMTNSEVDGTSVVALDGRIVLGEESQSMDNITYIDSTGLGTLVAAHVSAKLQGASSILSNLGTKFKEILQITKLVTVFQGVPYGSSSRRRFLKVERSTHGKVET